MVLEINTDNHENARGNKGSLQIILCPQIG